jgi:SP family facilitated glucose transporter-like MFS transporter 11
MDDKCVNDGHIFPPIRLFLTGCLVVLGGSFHFGFEMSIVNPAADILQQFIRQSFRNHYNEQELSEMAMRFIWPTIAGLFLFGATFGALAMPKIVDNYGRKIGLTISSIILVLALPMVAMSQLFMVSFIYNKVVDIYNLGI